MRFLVPLVVILSMSSLCLGKSPWRKRLDIVQEDIQAIKSLKKTDLMIDTRMFELYSEKLNIVIERENTLILESLTSTKFANELKLIKKIKSQILVNLNGSSKKVLGKTKNRNIIGRIHYFKALNYLSVKNSKGFYRSSKMAEKYLNEGQTKYLLRVKLAEFYFNEKKFKKALSYYKWLIGKKETKWQTKYLYNTAWCYFELNQFKLANKYILMSFKKSRNKSYFKIGKQLVDSIMLFYANARNTSEGVRFLAQNKVDTTENLLKLSHYTFEYGHQKDARQPLIYAMKNKVNSTDFQKILAKKIIVNRHVKEFTYIDNLLKRVKKDKRLNKIREEELYSNLTSYTGYLQELLKSHNSLQAGQRNKYLKFIINNFNFLSQLKRSNKRKNDFLIGETLFIYEKYDWALKQYRQNISKCKKQKCSWKKDLDRNFSGAFKCLEKLEGDKKLTMSKKSVFYSYISMAPKNKKRKIIYKKILALEYKSKKITKTIKLLSDYSKKYPEDKKSITDIYKNIVNGFIDKRNVKGLKSLRHRIVTGQLSVSKKEIKSLDSIIQQIHFKYAQRLIEKGEDQKARALLSKILVDRKEDRQLRKVAFRKILEIDYKRSDVGKMMKIFPYYKVFSFSKTEIDEAVFYLETMSLIKKASYIKPLLVSLSKKKAFNLNISFKTLLFKISSQVSLVSSMSMIKTNGEADYFLSQYLSSTVVVKRKVQKNAHRNSFVLNKLLPLIQRDFYLQLYGDGQILNFIKQFKTSNLIYKKLVPLYNSANKLKKYKITTVPLVDSKVAFTEQYFGDYLNRLVSSFEKKNSFIEKELQTINAHLIPMFLKRVRSSLRNDIQSLGSIKYNSKDVELIKAAKNEIVNVINAIKSKTTQLDKLHWDAVNRLSDHTNSGVSLYNFLKAQTSEKIGDQLWIDSY